MNYETIKELHEELNGVCQKCSQRCDKRVVSIVKDRDNLIMVCPDCKQGNERPYFKASEDHIKKHSSITGWDSVQVRDYLQVIPLGLALVHCNENTRSYWNWDEGSHIRMIEAENNGCIIDIRYYPKQKQSVQSKKKDNLQAQLNSDYKVLGYMEKLSIQKVITPKEYQQKKPNPLKIQNKIDYYKKEKRFPNYIVVFREKEGENSSFVIVDGYTNLLASKEMRLKFIEAVLIEKPFPKKNRTREYK